MDTHTTQAGTPAADDIQRDDAHQLLPLVAPALQALHAAGRPLVDAAHDLLARPESTERNVAAVLLRGAIAGLRRTWRHLESGLSTESAAGRALDDVMEALDALLPAPPSDDDRERREAEEERLRWAEIPPAWHDFARLHGTHSTCYARGLRAHTDGGDPDAGLHHEDHDARALCRGYLTAQEGIGPWPLLDFGSGCAYAAGLPATERNAVLAELAIAERHVNAALRLLGADEDDLSDVVAATIATLPSDDDE